MNVNIKFHIHLGRHHESFMAHLEFIIPKNGNLDQLPVRPIVSNLNTVTYQLAKHLSKISPSREYEWTIKGTRHFMETVKQQRA